MPVSLLYQLFFLDTRVIYLFHGLEILKAVLLMLTVWKGHAGPKRLSFAKDPIIWPLLSHG